MKKIQFFISDFADERQDVQKKTFTKWINSHLSKGNVPLIDDLYYDLRDGNRLLALLEMLTNKKYVRFTVILFPIRKQIS